MSASEWYTKLSAAIYSALHPQRAARTHHQNCVKDACEHIQYAAHLLTYEHKPETDLSTREKVFALLTDESVVGNATVTQLNMFEKMSLVAGAIVHAVEQVAHPNQSKQFKDSLDKLRHIPNEMQNLHTNLIVDLQTLANELVEAIFDVEFELESYFGLDAYYETLQRLILDRIVRARNGIDKLKHDKYRAQLFALVIDLVRETTGKSTTTPDDGITHAIEVMVQTQLNLHALDKVLARLDEIEGARSSVASLANATSLLRPQLSARTMARYNI